ncbi:MAG TPA: sugar transferase, partial [Thermoanaerobaculia bacterium]|nr:sugar transferase [Thermoanaerobaculia bacterium]
MRRMRPRDRLWGALRLAGDLTVALAAFYGAFALRMQVPLPFTSQLLPTDRLALAAGGIVATVFVGQLASLYFFGLYDPREPAPRLELARRLLPAVVVQGMMLVTWYFLTEIPFPRSVLVLYVVFDYLGLGLWRTFFDRLRQPPMRRVALVGCGPAAVEIADKIRLHAPHGLTLVGHVRPPDEQPPEDAEALASLGPHLGGIEEVADLVSEGRIEDLILAPSAVDWRMRMIDDLAAVRPSGADVLLLPGPFDALVGRMRYRWVRDVPLIEVVRHSEWRINRPLKRTLDVVGGSLLLLLALPLMAIVVAAIAFTSKGPILYRQQRIGRGRRPFTLYKFRTMVPDAEATTGEVLAVPVDPRLTPIGATLRRLRLDELPQLWNVLAGQMSLVGPRP